MNASVKTSSFLRRLGRDLSKNRLVYLMLIPVVAYYIIFKYFPMTKLVIAFQDYNIYKGVSGSKWIGFENFAKFFRVETNGRLIRNTFLISFYSILFSFPAPILLALMINEVPFRRTKKFVQTISYMPHFISLVVICGMLRDFCSSGGLFNQIRSVFGIEAVNLLSRPEYYRTIHIASGIWQEVGWSSIIYLATLSTVDMQLYEAAYIDGANKLQRIIHITLPALVPIMTVQFIMRVGNIMSVGYEKIILLYNSLTYETADVISTYMYRYGLLNGKYGMGTAVGLLNSAVNITVLLLVNTLFSKLTEESLF